jgi:tetratricopeptide (TPR) repeat protein
MSSNDDNISFHQRTADELARRYGEATSPPAELAQVLAWHLQQADDFAASAEWALQAAEGLVTQLDFAGAQRWCERALELLNRVPEGQHNRALIRAYALAVMVLEFGGQHREVLDYAKRLQRLAQAEHNAPAQVRAYVALGRAQRELRRLSAAEADLLKARELAARYNLFEADAEIFLHLSKVYQMQGRHLEALQQLELALVEQEQRNDQTQLARILTAIGDVYRILDASREALRFYKRAFVIELRAGSLLGHAILYDKLSLTYLARGETGEALQSQQESLRLRVQLNDIVGQARSHMVLGGIYSQLGQYDDALVEYEQSRQLEARTQNRRGLAIALCNLGDTARAVGDLARAEACYNEALELARYDNDQVALARLSRRIGDLKYSSGDLHAARAAWNEALAIRERLGHSEEVFELRGRLEHGPPKKDGGASAPSR